MNYLGVGVASLGGTYTFQYGHFSGTPIQSRNVMLHSLQARTGASSTAERHGESRNMCASGGDSKIAGHHFSAANCVVFMIGH